LRAVVDEGIRVFERCNQGAKGHEENLGLLFSLFQALELLDAVEVSLAGASTVGAVVLLRSTLEAIWALEWVARDVSKHGAACAVVLIHMKIAALEKLQDGHARRLQFVETLRQDRVAQRISAPIVAAASEQIAGLRRVLNQPHLRDAEAEFQRGKKKWEFYSFWDGPQNVEQLALRLGEGASYELLYRNWSQTSHAQDALRRITSSDGKPAIRAFRCGENLASQYHFAIHFGVRAMRTVLAHYRPDELNHSFKRWYLSEVEPAVHQLNVATPAENESAPPG